MKLILVQWVDPASDALGWMSRVDVELLSFTTCVSCGILIKETEEDITICLNLNPQNLSQVISIPKPCIKRMWALQVVRRGLGDKLEGKVPSAGIY